MKDSIFLFGAGHHCNVVIDIVEKEAKYKIIGIIDSKRDIGSKYNDYNIIGRQEDLNELSKKYNTNKGIVCIGDNYLRYKLSSLISEIISDFQFVNAIHPSVLLGKGVIIGVGNVLMPGVVVNPYAEIKNHCIINTKSTLEHNCLMGDFSSISAGVTTGGYVIIGKFSAIALGVTLFDRISIGENTVIGSGSLVTKDFPDNKLVYGNPAKIIRDRKLGERFLK